MQTKQQRKQKKNHSRKSDANHSFVEWLGQNLLKLKVSGYLFYTIVILGPLVGYFGSGHITVPTVSLTGLVVALTIGTVYAFIYWLIVNVLNVIGYLLCDVTKTATGGPSK